MTKIVLTRIIGIKPKFWSMPALLTMQARNFDLHSILTIKNPLINLNQLGSNQIFRLDRLLPPQSFSIFKNLSLSLQKTSSTGSSQCKAIIQRKMIQGSFIRKFPFVLWSSQPRLSRSKRRMDKWNEKDGMQMFMVIITWRPHGTTPEDSHENKKGSS